ncbi:ferredoxin--NADP reductase [Collimonas sp.]|jgi:ferredoxin--NADP+ reductase|uniref:ferredoxin--NADP reductase n=1 Tax=Collimonas sp. TaxID=1963772 RepID=UPI0037BECECC
MNSTPEKPTVSSLKASIERVTSVHRWTDKLFSFRTTRPAGYQFTPGQFARLGVVSGEEILWRAYSITSAADDNELEYFLVQVPGGQFSEQLKNLKPGDPMLVEKFSYGFMTTERFVDGEDLWMLATGTGLGPFISILQDPTVWQKFRNLILVHCVRNADELAYQELLASLPFRPQLAVGGARLQLLRATTRDTRVAAGNLQGRITGLLADGTLEAAAGLDISVEKSRIMMCGNPEMITATRELLHQRGLRPCRRTVPGQFVTEDYW